MALSSDRMRMWSKVVMGILTAFMVVFSAGCASGQPPAISQQPTEAPTAADTATTAPTTRPTATPTVLPDLPSAPFTWKGKTRPLLMAHYMPWYQNKTVSGNWGYHWSMNYFVPSQNADGTWKNFASHYTPLIGLYDSSDAAVLEYQVQTMKLSGIDGVIVDWYGIENFWDYGTINDSTVKLFQAVKKAGLKFVICYEDQTVKNMVDNGHIKQEDAVAHGQKVMRYLQDTWFGDEAYLKVSGKPVLFTFGPQYFMDDSDWKSLFSVLDPQPAFVTLENHVIPSQTASYPWPPMWAAKGGVLSHDILVSYLSDFAGKVKDFQWKYVVGGAYPGFHDMYKEAQVGASYGYLDALDGKTFRLTLQKSLDLNPDMIQLITWNDYSEGTNIEPTAEYGYRYLEMVQEARKVTGGGDFSYTAADLDLPLQLYQLRVKYAKDTGITAHLDEAAKALLDGDLAAAKNIMAANP